MNTTAITREKVRDALAWAFSRPQVLACTTLSEVLPLDLLMLRVQVQGWGWLHIRSPAGFALRMFFRDSGVIEMAVPVRAALTLRVANAWGGHSYPIDTQTLRDDVWHAPQEIFSLRLPDGVQPVYAQVEVPRTVGPGPALLPQWIAPPAFRLRATPADLRIPGLSLHPLPAIGQPEPAPLNPALPRWGAKVPLAPLEERMAQSRISS